MSTSSTASVPSGNRLVHASELDHRCLIPRRATFARSADTSQTSFARRGNARAAARRRARGGRSGRVGRGARRRGARRDSRARGVVASSRYRSSPASSRSNARLISASPSSIATPSRNRSSAASIVATSNSASMRLRHAVRQLGLDIVFGESRAAPPCTTLKPGSSRYIAAHDVEGDVDDRPPGLEFGALATLRRRVRGTAGPRARAGACSTATRSGKYRYTVPIDAPARSATICVVSRSKPVSSTISAAASSSASSRWRAASLRRLGSDRVACGSDRPQGSGRHSTRNLPQFAASLLLGGAASRPTTAPRFATRRARMTD